MANGLVYILQSLVSLYLMAFVVRLSMHWARSDFRNPIVQFVLTVTNPLVLPLRRFVPPVYKIDSATLIIFFLLQWATMGLLAPLACTTSPDVVTVLGLTVISGLRLILSVYTGVIFIYVLMSWIGGGGYNPSLVMISGLLRELAEPLLAPFRRIIPPIGGFDLSPLFLLLGLQGLAQTLVTPAIRLAAPFLCQIGVII
ncbi:MAG: YggT family protein [Gammaproteobacteria bacterium]|jgi:YggT family protein|nr:YggT family protein [Gammaproteobacteria bacterium]MDP7093831.1 YggT family protein [Gammaproteobacteria bacterium]MDP7270456.1 YggT family protein [Gammaproteobacteria bacterium]HJP05277.1 YggT family protein [Gammaproteobacteria bacterium]